MLWTPPGSVGVTVTANAAGQLSVSGATFQRSGSVIQDPVASASATGALAFDASGNLVSPASNVSGISLAGFRTCRGDEHNVGSLWR